MHSQGEPERRTRDRKLSTSFSLLVGAALLLYPVLVYVGETRVGTQWMALAVIAIGALRLLVFRFGSSDVQVGARFGAPQLLLVCGGAIVLGVVSAWRDSVDAMRYYPVLVNAVMLFFFATSLVWPPTIVEQIARLRDKNLPAEAIPYLRRVAAAWCAFFVVNGCIALYTALRTSFETWALYNGLIAYLLIGAMFAAEFLTRLRVMRGLRK